MKRFILALGAALVGPIALFSLRPPLAEVRQVPWNLTSPPLPTRDAVESGLAPPPGQTVQLPPGTDPGSISSIDLALMRLGPPPEEPATVELKLSSPGARFGTLNVVHHLSPAEQASLSSGAFINFPIELPSALAASPLLLHLELFASEGSRLFAVTRHTGALGINRGRGAAARTITHFTEDITSPLPDLTGIALSLEGYSAGRPQRATLKLFDPEEPATALRSAAAELPVGLASAWLDFNFAPLPQDAARELTLEVELPAGTSVRGTRGRPALRSYHAASDSPRHFATLAGAPQEQRDLVFRIRGKKRGVDLTGLDPSVLLGLALGVLGLTLAGLLTLWLPTAPQEARRQA